MRRFVIILGSLLLLIMAAAVALPFLVPVGAIVAQVENEVETKTGRALTIGGRVDLSYFPSIAVTADDVRFAGVRQGEDLLHIKQLAVRLRLLPLFSGRAEVERFVLTEPMIDLTVDRQGKPNWNVAMESAPVDLNTPPMLADLSLASVEVVDGRLRYADARTGLVKEANDVDITLSLPDLDGPLTLAASLGLNGLPVELDLTLDPVRPLIDGGASALKLDVTAGGAKLSLDGKADATPGKPLALTGALSANVASLRDLAEAVTGTAPEGLPFDDLSLTGTLTGTPARLSLAGLKAAAGDLSVVGDLSVRLDGARPSLGGTLALPALTIDPWLPPVAAPVPAGAPAAGWSREKIDLSALRLIDLDLTLKLAGLTVRGVTAGPTSLSTRLTDGKLAATLTDTAIFGGTLGGRLTLDAGKQAVAVGLTATAKGVQAEPLLTQFAGFTRLSGSTDAAVDIKAGGANQQELVSALNGTLNAVFRDGAVKGVNLAQIVRSALGQATAAPPQTDFAELGASAMITNGIAASEDFRLLAPLLRVTGKGTVNLPNRSVDFRLAPKLVASLEGQGTAKQEADGITVPVRVRGPFDNLSYTPDLSAAAKAALRDPAKAKEQLKQLKSKEGAKSLLQGVLGGKKP